MTRNEYLSELENVVQNCDFTARFSSGIDIKIYTDSLEQQNTALQARIKELEEPKSCTGCEYFEYNYLHKCETCDRQIRNDYFKLKDTK